MNYYYNLPLELQSYIEGFLLIKPNEIISNAEVFKTKKHIELITGNTGIGLINQREAFKNILRVDIYKKNELYSYDRALKSICNIICSNKVLYRKYKNCVELKDYKRKIVRYVIVYT